MKIKMDVVRKQIADGIRDGHIRLVTLPDAPEDLKTDVRVQEYLMAVTEAVEEKLRENNVVEMFYGSGEE